MISLIIGLSLKWRIQISAFLDVGGRTIPLRLRRRAAHARRLDATFMKWATTSLPHGYLVSITGQRAQVDVRDARRRSRPPPHASAPEARAAKIGEESR